MEPVVKHPVVVRFRVKKDIVFGVVGSARSGVVGANTVVVAGLKPPASEKVLAEGNADSFDFVAFFVSGVFVSNHNDSEHDIVVVYFSEVSHINLPSSSEQ